MIIIMGVSLSETQLWDGTRRALGIGTHTLFFFLSLLFYFCILNLPIYYSEHPLLLFSNFLRTRLLVDGRDRILERFEQTKHEVHQAGCLTLLLLASNYESDVLVGRW